jgi:hypothetical protein
MCVPCSANKCRIRESDLQAACLYIIFLNGYKKSTSPNQTGRLKNVSDGLFDYCRFRLSLQTS